MKASVRLVRFANRNLKLPYYHVSDMDCDDSHSKGKYIVANIMAYLIAQTHNFIWSKYWIFLPAIPKQSLTNNALLYRFWYCL